MPLHTLLQLSATDCSLQNLAYLFRLTRLMRRMGTGAACDLLMIKETTLWALEKGDLKEGCFDSIIKAIVGYNIWFDMTLILCKTVPSTADWKELDAKAKELGHKQHCKNWTLPGTIAGKAQDEEWREWGQPRLDRFYERIKNGGEGKEG